MFIRIFHSKGAGIASATRANADRATAEYALCHEVAVYERATSLPSSTAVVMIVTSDSLRVGQPFRV